MRTEFRGRRQRIDREDFDDPIFRSTQTSETSAVVEGTKRDTERLRKMVGRGDPGHKNKDQPISDLRFRHLLGRIDHLLGHRRGGTQRTAKQYLRDIHAFAIRSEREERITGVAKAGVSLSTLKVGDLVHTINGTVFEVMGTKKAGSKRLIHGLMCNATTLKREAYECAWDIKSGRPYNFGGFGIGHASDDRRDRIRGVGPVTQDGLGAWMPDTWKRGRHKREVIRILERWAKKSDYDTMCAVDVIKKIGDRALLPTLRKIAGSDKLGSEEAQKLLRRWEAKA